LFTGTPGRLVESVTGLIFHDDPCRIASVKYDFGANALVFVLQADHRFGSLGIMPDAVKVAGIAETNAMVPGPNACVYLVVLAPMPPARAKTLRDEHNSGTLAIEVVFQVANYSTEQEAVWGEVEKHDYLQFTVTPRVLSIDFRDNRSRVESAPRLPEGETTQNVAETPVNREPARVVQEALVHPAQTFTSTSAPRLSVTVECDTPWRTAVVSGREHLRISHPAAGDGDKHEETIHIYVRPMSDYPGVEHPAQLYARMATTAHNQRYKPLYNSTFISGCGTRGVCSSWEFVQDDEPQREMVACFIVGEKAITIFCRAHRDEYAEWEQRFRDAVSSLTIDAASHGTVGRGETVTERDVRSEIEQEDANGYRVDEVRGSTNELQFAGKMRLPDGRVKFHVRCNGQSHFVEKGEAFAGMYSVQGYTERQERVMDDVLKLQRTVDTSVLVLSAGQESIRLERGKSAFPHQCYSAVLRHISTGQDAFVRRGDSVTLGGQRLSILGVAPDGRVSARNRDTGKEFTAVPH